MNYLFVFAGGGLGCVFRYVIGILMHRTQMNFPLATLLANVISCAIFAFVLWWTQLKPGTGDFMRPLLLTGFCGGLSTFSAFSYETYLLFQKQMYLMGIVNILLSCLLCLSLFYLLSKNSSDGFQ